MIVRRILTYNNEAKHLSVERKADAYAHQVSDTMEYIEKAWHGKRGLAACLWSDNK